MGITIKPGQCFSTYWGQQSAHTALASSCCRFWNREVQREQIRYLELFISILACVPVCCVICVKPHILKSWHPSVSYSDMWGSHSLVAEDSGPLGCDPVVFVEWFLMFWRINVPLSSRTQQVSSWTAVGDEGIMIVVNTVTTHPMMQGHILISLSVCRNELVSWKR